ncbi:kallikrein-14-like [Falco rusticolus]|uniref:kallikrein-14-like n=1 Tax=Falco rusticolus TaxID=120794 RepID=UPI00188666DF|nr:kallikrein-14-like [Falco rusticolus]
MEPLPIALLLLLLTGGTHGQTTGGPCPQGAAPWGGPCPSGRSQTQAGPAVASVPSSPGGGQAEQDEDRIIGGYPCIPLSQPWQVYIYRPIRCGGVLLRDRWVLSAAHCNSRGLRLRLGENDLQRREGAEQDRAVAKTIPHPAFDPTTLDNDLLLLKLERPVALGPAVRPLPLPPACAPPGATCLVSGWGTVTTPQVTLPRHLICAYVNILPDAECRRAYPQRVTPNMLCAGVRNKRIDSCQGDSGGPLSCNGTLQGIVSWGLQTCALPGRPGVYTRVCNYVGWILETMNRN